jgi:hypothetical protein
MKQMTPAAAYGVAALVVSLVAAAPAHAAPDFRQIFRWDGAGSPPIATDDEARGVLLRHGLSQISELGRVGDYFEANARLGGKPVVAYLFDNGSLKIDRHPAAMVETGTRLIPPRG